MSETNLILGVLGLPPESARNCTQELHPIPNGEFKKTVNGDLLFLEASGNKKYRSVISCKDINSPIIEGLWIGSSINVGCIQNLWQSINPGEQKTTLIRPPVKDSINAMKASGDSVKFDFDDNSNEVKLPKMYDEKIFVSFRPWLVMTVVDFSLETNEWNMNGGWKIILEE
ncbi:hypothetical protein FACS189449_06920 [Alphaproteobacteria bacterium]|nr:hypothetical protein FACS189449_06920 [Alphaproteobacteria bacterium]